jgi:hypothetical protein
VANAPAWRGESHGGHAGSVSQPSDDGWDTATHIRSASAETDYPTASSHPASYEPNYDRPPGYGPTASVPDSTAEETEGQTPRSDSDTTTRRPTPSRIHRTSQAPERGIAGWQAVLVLIGIAAVGGAIDLLRGSSVKGGFNIALIIASIVAILLVRRRDMFPVLVAPPLVYFVASAGLLYFRSSGLQDRSRLLDAAINWLVYGFPAIAGATAAVLIIGGLRLLLRR